MVFFEGRDPQTCTFGLSGCRVNPRRPLGIPGRPQGKKTRNCGGRRKKKARNFWAPPPFWAPPFGPPPFGPPSLRAVTLRAPTLGALTFSFSGPPLLWAPPFRPPSLFGAPEFGPPPFGRRNSGPHFFWVWTPTFLILSYCSFVLFLCIFHCFYFLFFFFFFFFFEMFTVFLFFLVSPKISKNLFIFLFFFFRKKIFHFFKLGRRGGEGGKPKPQTSFYFGRGGYYPPKVWGPFKQVSAAACALLLPLWLISLCVFVRIRLRVFCSTRALVSATPASTCDWGFVNGTSSISGMSAEMSRNWPFCCSLCFFTGRLL